MTQSPVDITASPAAEQQVLHHGKTYQTIKEGLAYILVPATDPKTPQVVPKGDGQLQNVFYNPIQQFNRDLSVLAIKAYGEETIERKKKLSQKKRQQRSKRKRESDIASGVPRKAGRLDNGGPRMEDIQASISRDVDQEGGGDIEGIAAEENNEEEAEQAVVISTESIPSKADTTAPELPSSTEHPINTAPAPQPNSTTTPTPFKILDALSATGLRALRYSHEIPFVTSVTANDMLPDAVRVIKMNAKHNKLEEKITAVTGNALTHMYSFVGGPTDAEGHSISKYDVIDLDPYGTAANFLDAAVQAVRDDGGLLCVTCTDAGVWASNGYPEKCYSLYGGVPMKGLHSHEGGLRLILNSIASSAARYGLSIEPLLSLSIDFYARVFVRVYKSALDVKFLAGKTMLVYNCDQGCTAWTTQMVGRNKLGEGKIKKGKESGVWQWKHVLNTGPTVDKNCRHCGRVMHMAGPMWAGPIHSPAFIKRILADLPNVSKETYKTTDRIEGMLHTALEEIFPVEENPNSPTATSITGKYDPSAIDPVPFFFIPSALSKIIHCVTPHESALKGALRTLGYTVGRSHCKGGAIKTNAPWEVVWEVMREWVKQKCPVKEGAIREGTAGYIIMAMDKVKDDVKNEMKDEADDKGKDDLKNGVKENAKDETVKEGKEKLEIVFDEKLGMEEDVKKLVRYQVNPRENWGPMNRARGHTAKEN